MKKPAIRLTQIEQAHPITEESDGAFLDLLEQGLLLALGERGLLTQPQLRAAEDRRRKRTPQDGAP